MEDKKKEDKADTTGTLNEPSIVGYLLKKTPHNSWQRRQCYATRNKFMYFKHKIANDGVQIKMKDDDHPQGIVSLHQAHCYIPPPDDINVARKEHCFVLRSNNKDFYFSCDNKQEQGNWVSFLCKTIEDLATGKDSRVAHSFKKVSFSRATICSKCESFIWGFGKNGFLCTVCHTCVHKKCIFKVGENCTDKDTSANSRAAKTRSMAIFSHKDSDSGDEKMSAKDKKIKELKAMLKAVEEREEMAIKETKMKFEEQIEEIFAEFRAREAHEVALAEFKYEQQMEPLLIEISRRASVK